jgi:hypothetical protein
MCTKYKQSVEPTSSLINTLSNEIGRVGLVESINVLEGVMRLSVGHRSRFEPTIKDFLDSLQITLALLGGDGDTVDTLSVEIGDIISTGKFLELFNGADADDFLHVLTGPEGDGGTPVSVSGDVPITGVLEPLTESTLSDVLWDPTMSASLGIKSNHCVPSGLFVVGDKLITHMSNSNEPRRDSSVDERSSGPAISFTSRDQSKRLTSSRRDNYG